VRPDLYEYFFTCSYSYEEQGFFGTVRSKLLQKTLIGPAKNRLPGAENPGRKKNKEEKGK